MSNEKPNYLFIGLTVAICALFGALMWLFTAKLPIEGEITGWIVRGAFMLSVVLTGFVIYFKFGRANNQAQEIVLWVGIGTELLIMAATFLTVVHPDLIANTDAARFVGLVSGLNVVTTVFCVVLFFAFDDSTKEQQKLAADRKALIRAMYNEQLNSAETAEMVRQQARHDVREQIAQEMRVASYKLVTPMQVSALPGATIKQAETQAVNFQTPQQS